ncbi:MAG: hypothetical protein LAT51_01680 [Flavobacteriaceae bacterium]|nr:hypothetical protein [Flavobacteriaceae bacterium]
MEAKKMNQILMKAFGELSPESRPFVPGFKNEIQRKESHFMKLKKTFSNA